MRFEICWASLTVGSKFIVFALFYFAFALPVWGLIFGGAYTWKGLFSEFYGKYFGLNRPFPSSKKSHFQNEAKCETFVVKMSFICIIIKNHFISIVSHLASL